MQQKLGISEVVKVEETEPAIVEVTVKLIDGDTAVLRMNAFAAQTLARSIAALGA